MILVVALEMIKSKFRVGNLFNTGHTGNPALNSLKWNCIGSLGNWYYRMNDACVGLVKHGS